MNFDKILNKFSRFIKKKWPTPKLDIHEEEPFFLFILTPPFSGSTALAQILNSCENSTFLNKRGEGQWLVPGMSASDRWNPKKELNWESIRSVWLKRFFKIKSLVQNVDLIIEKSPPNILRVKELVNVFPNHFLFAFNRNPYANCSSILHRNHDVEWLSEKKRESIISNLASEWLERSNWIRK